MSIEQLIETMKGQTLPGVWSKGIQLSKTDSIKLIQKKDKEDEWILSVVSPGLTIQPKVTLWIKEGDWHCDCKDKNDPCHHIIGCALKIKHKKDEFLNQSNSTESKDHLSYEFYELDGLLSLRRTLITKGIKKILDKTLVSLTGGMRSGRLPHLKLILTQDDYRVDQILGVRPNPVLEADQVLSIFKAIHQSPYVFFEGKKVTLETKKFIPRVVIEEEKDSSFLLKSSPSLQTLKTFRNEALFYEDTLYYFKDIQFLRKTHFMKTERDILFLEVIPALEEHTRVSLNLKNVPTVYNLDPCLTFKLDPLDSDFFYVTAFITYMHEGIPRAVLKKDALEYENENTLINRKLDDELKLKRSLFHDYRLEIETPKKITTSMWLELKNAYSAPVMNHQNLFDTLDEPLHFSATHSKEGIEVGFYSPKMPENKISLDQVLRAYRQNESFIKISDDVWAKIPLSFLNEKFDRLEALLDLQKENEKLPIYTALEALELVEDSGGATQTANNLQEIKAALSETTHFPLPELNPNLKAMLRPYQENGVRWLKFLTDYQMGALLADDMGLGKTLQVLCVLTQKTLIICPTSVMKSWTDQAKVFRPELKICQYHGGSRQWAEDADIYLTSYGIVREELSTFLEHKWKMIVLDESQTIKNPKSLIAQACFQLNAERKIALSGTPIENRLSDVCSQFKFLNPGLLGKQDSNQPELLQKKVRPFILRRLKKDVLKELPPKTEITLTCELSEKEIEIYQTLTTATREALKKAFETKASVFSILEILLRLRQASCHPGLIFDAYKDFASSKLTLLIESLHSSIEQGHRCLVFSQWTSFLDIIEPALQKESIGYVRLDGTTQNRSQIIDKFQDDNGPPVFLISLKAGGVGLTLTQADHVYLLDPWWNPAVEEQATDRAHRFGQLKPVFVYRLIAQNTIEEKIIELQQFKKSLSDQLIGTTPQNANLTRDDLEMLFKSI